MYYGCLKYSDCCIKFIKINRYGYGLARDCIPGSMGDASCRNWSHLWVIMQIPVLKQCRCIFLNAHPGETAPRLMQFGSKAFPDTGLEMVQKYQPWGESLTLQSKTWHETNQERGGLKFFSPFSVSMGRMGDCLVSWSCIEAIDCITDVISL